MKGINYDTRPFEISAEFGSEGRLSSDCVEHIAKIFDEFGFVIIVGLLTGQEAQKGLDIIRVTLDDPRRLKGKFGSRLDHKFNRRDFCPLPATEPVLSFVAMLCKKLGGIIKQYCDMTRPIIEISTLTSYSGSSHQYIHRDYGNVISIIVSVEDVSKEQGGTLFIPRTHNPPSKKTRKLMDNYKQLFNLRILYYNLVKLWRIRKLLAAGEFRARVISRNFDSHQPNLSSFLSKKGRHINLFMLLKKLGQLYKLREKFHAYDCFQVSPKRGTVILYFSEIMHAGPDNQVENPRHFLSLNIARPTLLRGEIDEGRYMLHPSFISEPKTLAQILDIQV